MVDVVCMVVFFIDKVFKIKSCFFLPFSNATSTRRKLFVTFRSGFTAGVAVVGQFAVDFV